MDNSPHGGAIVIFEFSAQRICKESFGNGSDELLAFAQQQLAKLGRALKFLTTGKLSRGIDHRATVGGAPQPDRIVIF